MEPAQEVEVGLSVHSRRHHSLDSPPPLRNDVMVPARAGTAQTRRTMAMDLLKLLFKAIRSSREPGAPPRSEIYHWRCETCGEHFQGLERQHVGNVAASHRRRMGGKCRTPKVYAAEV